MTVRFRNDISGRQRDVINHNFRIPACINMPNRQLNKGLRFDGVSVQDFNSILRRSLVVKLKGKLVGKKAIDKLGGEEAAALRHTFLSDNSLKRFLTSKAACAASLKLARGWQDIHGLAGADSTIEGYATGGDGGVTFYTIRDACQL